MGNVVQPTPVKLVLPMLAVDPEYFLKASTRLSECFGSLDYTSPILPFTHTTYYEPEFGANLLRQFIAFKALVDPGELASIKVLTNALELEFAIAGKRMVNLDPGYLSLAKFILATTKDQGHRIYLGQGIYAEITCSYRQGQWQANSWTYPDYRTPEYFAILKDLRAILVAQLRQKV